MTKEVNKTISDLLSSKDKEQLINSLNNPPKPNKRLRLASLLHEELFESSKSQVVKEVFGSDNVEDIKLIKPDEKALEGIPTIN